MNSGSPAGKRSKDAYRIVEDAPTLRAAMRNREWMAETGERFAYRCLPLVIANTHGWELLCPFTIEAYWNGGNSRDSVEIRAEQPYGGFVTSHFGNGVLRFHTGYIFQTDPEYSLFVSGPSNWPRDGVHALTGNRGDGLAALPIHHELSIHRGGWPDHLREG